MNQCPLRTSVIGSYPFPAWLEHASQHLDRFGSEDRSELQSDAVTCAVKDQLAAGLDVITDGEQSRLDFNLSFYGYLQESIWSQPRPVGGARLLMTNGDAMRSWLHCRPLADWEPSRNTGAWRPSPANWVRPVG